MAVDAIYKLLDSRAPNIKRDDRRGTYGKLTPVTRLGL